MFLSHTIQRKYTKSMDYYSLRCNDGTTLRAAKFIDAITQHPFSKAIDDSIKAVQYL